MLAVIKMDEQQFIEWLLEGLKEFQKSGYTYRFKDIQSAKESAEEFILLHNIFLSDRTGEVINKDFLKITYPCRWKYNILRANCLIQLRYLPITENNG